MLPFKRSNYCPIEKEEGEKAQPFHGRVGAYQLGPNGCNTRESTETATIQNELSVSFKCDKDPEMSSMREDRARWDHVGDVDQFFSFIYEYYQQNGIRCIVLRYFFSLFRFAFVVFFSTILLQCVDYGVIFNTKNTTLSGIPLPEKKHIQDVFIPQCYRHFNPLVQIALFLAFLFWIGHFARLCCRLVHFYETRNFYATQLQISDSDLHDLSWNDVVHNLCRTQERVHLIVNRDSISPLDIYQRILRHRNYFVALVHKSLLPPQIRLPFVGPVHYLSSGLRFNIEWLLFWGPWSPWKSSYALKEEFKEQINLERIAQSMQRNLLVMSAVNLFFLPFVVVYQVLFSFFSYSEHYQRDRHMLGMRKYSNYGREKLRHFNELDSELDARLNRSYESAVQYTDQFVSTFPKIIAKNVAFVAAAIFVVLCALTAYDEDTLQIEHVTTLITISGAIILACRVFIPNEHMVFCPHHKMRLIVANIHYAPKSWLSKAHSKETYAEFTQIFRLKAELLIEELLSPLLTPLILYFCIRPRVMEIVEFFHKYTVQVDGLGDVCSFAQMDICRDGENRLAPLNSSVIVRDSSNDTKHKQSNSYGKVELSLLNFAVQHPGWTPPKECAEFIENVKALVAREIDIVSRSNGFGDDANANNSSVLDAQTLSSLQESAHASVRLPSSVILPSECLRCSASQNMAMSVVQDDQNEKRIASSPPPPPLSVSICPNATSRVGRPLLDDVADSLHPSHLSHLATSTYIQPPSSAANVQPRNVQESNFRALEMSMQALLVNQMLFSNSPAQPPFFSSRHRFLGYGSIPLGSVSRRCPNVAADSVADSNIFGVPAGASQIHLVDDMDNEFSAPKNGRAV